MLVVLVIAIICSVVTFIMRLAADILDNHGFHYLANLIDGRHKYIYEVEYPFRKSHSQRSNKEE